jgi:hypothetical protein
MFKKIYSILVITFLAINTNSEAQIVINEYSCANVTNYADNFSKYEDWFELFNTGTSPVNIGGYYLSDKLNQPTKWMIPSGTTLNANARIIFMHPENIDRHLHIPLRICNQDPSDTNI